MSITEKLEKLEDELFILEMKDIWDANDYKQADILRKQIREIKNDRGNE